MGSALLLGSGMAAAQINLDGTAAAGNAPEPVRLAVETISTAAANQTTSPAGAVLGYNVTLPTTTLRVTARTAVPSGYFVRVKLNGAVFRGTIADPTGTTAVQGGAGMDQIVYSVPTTGIALNANFDLVVTANIAVASAESGAVSATILAYKDQFDAIDGSNALGAQYFGGSATFIEKVSGVTATVLPGRTATADAAVGFRWFVNPNAATDGNANSASATLGNFMVAERDSNADADVQAIDASTGAVVAPNAIIVPARGVTLTIEGDLSIGAFELTRDDPATGTPAAPMVEVTCPDAETGSADVPLKGNVRGTEDAPNTAMLSTSQATTNAAGDTITPAFAGASGTFTLCVTVDTMGPMSNESPIPDGQYMGTISLPNVNAAVAPRELATGVLGNIMRNGASVNVAYLTTSEKHNQRLIIVNRGTRPISMTDIQFHTEDGTEADLSDAAKAAADIPDAGTIMPGEAVMHRVSDMLSITGNSRRTAASIAFNGVASQISVATTQVNLSDGSTDTVMWPVN